MIRRILCALALFLAVATDASGMNDAANLPKVYCSVQATAPALADKDVFPLRCDTTGALVISQSSAPAIGGNSTPISCASGNQANANAVCTLAAAVGKTTYITGFRCNAAGATAALIVNLTVAGMVTGTQTYTFGYPAGATAMGTAVAREFAAAVPASATNTAIVVTLPAGGAGNTNASCNAEGFQL